MTLVPDTAPDMSELIGTPDLPRSGRNVLALPCLDCRTLLPEPPWSFEFEDYVIDDVARCEVCGLQYSGDLLRTADAEAWAYIMLNRFFCRACSTTESVCIVHTIGRRIVACPDHGPAPLVDFSRSSGPHPTSERAYEQTGLAGSTRPGSVRHGYPAPTSRPLAAASGREVGTARP